MSRQRLNIFYRLTSWCGQKFIAVIERLMPINASAAHIVPEWAREFSLHVERIRAEFLELYDENLREFSLISPEQKRITHGRSWKVFILRAYTRPLLANRKRCPHTSALCDAIPEITSAMFSVLEPLTHITPHRGPYAGVLRCHIPLIVPEGDCGIRVGREVFRWETGKALVFDDTLDHEAWNNTTDRRVVLFIDYLRPWPWPLSIINFAVIKLIGFSPFVGRILRASS